MEQNNASEIIMLSKKKFLAGCAGVSLIILAVGHFSPIPSWVVAFEVMAVILSLFLLGSMKYQLDKNALTYGGGLVIFATFWQGWWPTSALRQSVQAGDHEYLIHFFGHYFLTLHGWDELIHADTMLFILGLTLFVCAIAQTRILESVSFAVLKKNKGAVVTTVAILTGIVAFSSGILDGVSMIGLMIRTLVIILLLARANEEAILFSVMVSTIVTTVCGMWLAYGEPPNLIMKANLHPYLDNAFFLRYCVPAAIGSYLIVFWNISRRLSGRKIDMEKLDIVDRYTADVRFLQASRHGEVLTPIEFLEAHKDLLGTLLAPVVKRLHAGESMGAALIQENVPQSARKELLGKYVSEDLSAALDEHYAHVVKQNAEHLGASEIKIKNLLETISKDRLKCQKIGGLSFVPFIGLLVWHGFDHHVPLFLASFTGFFIAFAGIFSIEKMRKLALREAVHEYMEYLFLLPLFFSITLLQKTGFFDQLSGLLHTGIEKLGASHVAYLQFLGATFLSAILDNNIVADFTSRALHGLELGTLHLFAMAQIAGYAAGGCWTHIGSAQSVVAYSFIKREVNEKFTPFQWIRLMTPVILEIALLMTVVVYGEGILLQYLH